jgi:hypothetical protein
LPVAAPPIVIDVVTVHPKMRLLPPPATAEPVVAVAVVVAAEAEDEAVMSANEVVVRLGPLVGVRSLRPWDRMIRRASPLSEGTTAGMPSSPLPSPLRAARRVGPRNDARRGELPVRREEKRPTDAEHLPPPDCNTDLVAAGSALACRSLVLVWMVQRRT